MDKYSSIDDTLAQQDQMKPLIRIFFTALLAFSLTASAQSSKAEKAEKAAPATGKAQKKAKKKAMDGPQCAAMTKDGDRCKREASAGSKFCWQHGGKKKS
jgi:hypothetical protein